MAAQQLLNIVYALDIKFWVRWCTCSMWRMLLPYYLLFLISIMLFLKTDIATYIIYFQGLRARSPCNGNHFSSIMILSIIGEGSEPLSMVFNDQPRDIYVADVRPHVRF